MYEFYDAIKFNVKKVKGCGCFWKSGDQNYKNDAINYLISFMFISRWPLRPALTKRTWLISSEVTMPPRPHFPLPPTVIYMQYCTKANKISFGQYKVKKTLPYPPLIISYVTFFFLWRLFLFLFRLYGNILLIDRNKKTNNNDDTR